MMLLQEAIEHSLESGRLINAGWLTLIVTLVVFAFGMFFAIKRKESFRYWRIISTMTLIGFAAMSGLMDEALKIIAKFLGAQ